VIKAYHLNKYKDVEDYHILKNRLHGLHCDRVVYLFTSPQSLAGSSKWWRTLLILAKTNRVSLVCINEAHDVMQQCRNFRPKFVEVVTNISKLFQASQRIAMSATYLRHDINGLLRLLNVVPGDTNLIWTKMN
jgi:superfamily II DNA helicase RecQ